MGSGVIIRHPTQYPTWQIAIGIDFLLSFRVPNSVRTSVTNLEKSFIKHFQIRCRAINQQVYRFPSL